MRPTVSEQLAGMSVILTGVVADHLDDDYARDVLVGAANTLMTLSRTWHTIPEFLRWDSTTTATILDLIGQTSPPPPADWFDIPAAEEYHREMRERLEQSIPMIVENATARLAMVAHFRERVKRFTALAREGN
jgi:hypothetical protein